VRPDSWKSPASSGEAMARPTISGRSIQGERRGAGLNGKKIPAGAIELPPNPPGSPPVFILEKDQLKFPVTSAAELQFNVRLLATLTMNMRHQWAALGGDDSKLDTNRGVNFIGYLQQAMASSGFF
jgi:hypothetical protein